MTTKTSPQTLLFPRSRWTKARACAWLKSHGFRCGKVDTTAANLRFRQFPPTRCRKGRYGTKKWKTGGGTVTAVFCATKRGR